MRRLGRFIVRLFAGIGLLVVLLVVALGLLVWQLAHYEPSLPDSMIITADLNQDLVDGPESDPFSRLLLGNKSTLRGVVEGLERAAGDARVKGLYVRLGDDALGIGKVQELRDAIAAFRAKGKFAIAFSESFGELGPGTRPYYLATAFDRIWLQPLGTLGLTGLSSQVPFVRGTLDALGIDPEFEHRSEYKSAMNSLTETAMTGPQREETEALLRSVAGQIARDIAAARKLTPEQVTGLVDRGPFLADDAKQAQLVDAVGYRDEAVADARQRAGSGSELVTMSHYLDVAGRPHRSGPAIALIYATGLITRDSSVGSPLSENRDASAHQLTRAFRAAFRDSEVRAIVLRIDSPGGSAIASETIWREVARARERGKPVIVSMGNVAASGGYYIAAPADKIVAQPGTITGSIGVLAGKLVISGLLQKLGISIDTVQQGANAELFSATQPFSDEGRRRLNRFLDETYSGFKQRVADGRHLSGDAVESVAKGRVWTGEDAKAKGLVDELGGYQTAIALAKTAAKIPADSAYKLVVFPKEKNAAELLYTRLTEGDSDSETSGSSALQRGFAALGSALAQIEAAADENVLRLRPGGEVR